MQPRKGLSWLTGTWEWIVHRGGKAFPDIDAIRPRDRITNAIKRANARNLRISQEGDDTETPL
jgi:hypothetical protein